MKQIWLSNFLVLFANVAFAQTDSSWSKQPSLKFGFLLETFYVQDFNKPEQNFRQTFFYNHNRHQELNINLGLISLALEHEKYRANLALQAGTYVNDNYAQESATLKNIFEANIGISLNKKNNLWLDLGILPSHIGFESAIGPDNWTLTRSLLAENSPYFFGGATLSYQPSQAWNLALVFMNGWQRIQRLEANSLPALGTQLTYNPSPKINLNWSSFVGTDDPDSIRRIRFFNNFYGQFQLSENLGLITGFDLGFQQQSLNHSAYHAWLSPVIIAQLRLNQYWKTALRLEYYQDKNQVMIISNNLNHGFQSLGFSFNLDYAPLPSLLARLETRYLRSPNPSFYASNHLVNDNLFVGISLALRFSELLIK